MLNGPGPIRVGASGYCRGFRRGILHRVIDDCKLQGVMSLRAYGVILGCCSGTQIKLLYEGNGNPKIYYISQVWLHKV